MGQQQRSSGWYVDVWYLPPSGSSRLSDQVQLRSITTFIIEEGGGSRPLIDNDVRLNEWSGRR